MRLAYLDGLRGVAALNVVFAHFVLAFEPALYLGTITFGAPAPPDTPVLAGALWIAQTPLVLLFSPQFAVTIFFVLSGFVLASSMSAQPAPLIALGVRRWVRLSGPVAVTTVFIWLWLASGWHPYDALSALNKSDWLAHNFDWVRWQANNLAIAVYQALVDVYLHNRHWWNTSLWTLQVELWGSLLLFLAYAVVPPARVWRVAAALAAVALTWRGDYAGFPMGAALFELRPAVSRAFGARQPLGWLVGLAVFAAALLLGGAPVYSTGWTAYTPLVRWVAPYAANPLLVFHRVGAMLLVAVTLFAPPIQAALSTRPALFLGRVSFMTYLLHVPLICSIASGAMLLAWPLVGYHAACALVLTGLLVVLLGLASLATRWIDQPCIALARRVGRRASSRGLIVRRAAAG